MKAKTDISPSLKVHSSKCLKLKFSFLFMEKPGKDYKTPPHCCSPRWQDRVSSHSRTVKDRTRMDAREQKVNGRHRVRLPGNYSG